MNNGLTGTLPDGIGSLTNLETFNVGFNALTGTVPPALFDIATLDDIAIDHNMLEGALPAALVTLNPSDFKASHNGCFVAEDPQTEAWLTAADPEWACGCTMTCL